jgi:glycerophosphoryl diester phosphodiesterase
MQRRAPGWLRQTPIAHRGLHDARAPENSRAAFAAAIASGYAIELDVHLGTGDVLPVFHDDDLQRMTGTAGAIANAPWSVLETLRLGDTDETIPRLHEVLAQVDGRVPLVVEVKAGARPRQTARAVAAALASYRGPLAVQSFHPLALVELRRALPDAVLGVLSCDFTDEDLPAVQKFALRRLLLAPWSRPDYVAYALDALPYWAPSVARRLGLPLVAWTVRDQAQLQRARRVADNVIFEHVRP